jgi:outer membrane protein
MSTKILAALVVAAAAFALSAAAAAEPAWYAAQPDGDWMVRLRGLAVVPNETLDVDQDATAHGKISTSVVPELDITYFFTPNFAAELILGVTPHDVTGTGSITGADIGSVWLLPPTLTAQYHVTQLGDWTGVEALSKVKPYFGAGVNYTMFFNEDAGQFADISYDDSFGVALQAGVDIEVAPGLYVNADMKYIMLETDWSINNGALTGSAEINPLIIGVGVGYRF